MLQNLYQAGQNLSFIQGNKITSFYCSKMKFCHGNDLAEISKLS